MTTLPHAILIDLDDTILDDAGNVDQSWRDACAEASRLVPGLDASRLRTAITNEADRFWEDPSRSKEGRLNLRVATKGIVAAAFRALECDRLDTAHQIAELYRDLREERISPFPGAIETLAGLRATGLMTNGAGPAQRTKIARFGLEKYFGEIVIEGEFGVGKPDERVFLTLLGALNARPEEAWAVGDNLEFDVLAPMRLGLHGVWVNQSANGLPADASGMPDRTVRALSELASLAR